MKNQFKRAWDFITDPNKRFLALSNRGFYDHMDDKTYLQKMFKARLGYELDLNNPHTFNEKLQWLKLNDRKAMYTVMVDKIEAKKFVANAIGEKYIIPTIAVWDNFESIDFNLLPKRFVLKCSHDSGGLIICKDKNKLDMVSTKAKLTAALQHNYYLHGREWPYKDVKPRIFAEQYMQEKNNPDESNSTNSELKDYKIFTFNGKVQYIEVDYDRFIDHHRNFYSTDWQYVPFAIRYPTDPQKDIPKPVCLSEMLSIAEKLAEKAGSPPFLRVDLYVINDQPYWGELTFFHETGMGQFDPREYDDLLGEMIHLDIDCK